jgi:hypothetical protein
MEAAVAQARSSYVVPFAIPAAWLALLGLAGLAGLTSWGQEGHPSNSLILFLYGLLAAPVLGLAGGAYVWIQRRRYPVRLYAAAIVAHLCLVAAGVWFWIMVWLT